jgi:hypothetical protein
LLTALVTPPDSALMDEIEIGAENRCAAATFQVFPDEHGK